MSGLSPERREELAEAIRVGLLARRGPNSFGPALPDQAADALAPLIAEWLFRESIEDRNAEGDEMHVLGYQRGHKAGLAEARARVEALTPMVLDEWPLSGEWLCRPDVLAALNGGE